MCGREALASPINMRENMPMIRNVVTEYLHGRVETHTKEIILMTSDMVSEKCIGMMEVVIKETGKGVYSMVRVNIIIM